MFFTQELLASRESGFGLLWLAATLGARSTFKKLPRRSIITADITQLCDLIAEPIEPLALRLSSNLLVGVTRVYKVKQEIFLNDVTACFASLKKAIQDLGKCSTALDSQLQMVQSTVRSSAVTLQSNATAAITMDFDALVADWDEYLNIGDHSRSRLDADDQDFGSKEPSGNWAKHSNSRAPAHIECNRADHTLTEHYEDILSASFDLSHHDNEHGFFIPSSSQIEGIGFDDNFFDPIDGLDIGALADELALELGWKTPQTGNKKLPNAPFVEGDPGLVFDRINRNDSISEQTSLVGSGVSVYENFLKRKTNDCDAYEENQAYPDIPLQVNMTPPQPPPALFSRISMPENERFISLDENAVAQRVKEKTKGIKKMRLHLDARTELTDEELRVARAQYLQAQDSLRREIGRKHSEKHCGRILAEKVLGVPSSISAPALVDFWLESIKPHAEAFHIHIGAAEQAPRKRRKVHDARTEPITDDAVISLNTERDYMAMDVDIDPGIADIGPPNYPRSSEEPGQGRQLSRANSVTRDLPLGLSVQRGSESQKSSLFPWDHAGGSPSSSVFGMLKINSDLVVEHADTRMRGSSQSHRNSPLPSANVASIGSGFSPASFIKQPLGLGDDDYAFEVEIQDRSVALQSDLNQVSLERNSLNFLEYVKMQSHSLPLGTATLPFDTVVPQLTSTRRVAASAFYHCLVLATKDLLRLEQADSHGLPIIITVL